MVGGDWIAAKELNSNHHVFRGEGDGRGLKQKLRKIHIMVTLVKFLTGNAGEPG